MRGGQVFGGGGHKNASGCSVEGSYADARRRWSTRLHRGDGARRGHRRVPVVTDGRRPRSPTAGSSSTSPPADVARYRRARPARRWASRGRAHGHARSAGDRVLPLLVGRATRLAQFLADARRSTRRVRFGWATDTYEPPGTAARTGGDALPSRPSSTPRSIDFAAHSMQRPPAFSAKQSAANGRTTWRAPRSARSNSRPVPVTVPRARSAPARWRASRDARHVLGRILCAVARARPRRRARHAARTWRRCGGPASGALHARSAVGLERAARPTVTRAPAAVVPMADILPDLPAVRLSEHDVARVRRRPGSAARRAARPMAAPRANRIRLLAPDGR